MGEDAALLLCPLCYLRKTRKMKPPGSTVQWKVVKPRSQTLSPWRTLGISRAALPHLHGHDVICYGGRGTWYLDGPYRRARKSGMVV